MKDEFELVHPSSFILYFEGSTAMEPVSET
jgi:hypothetical protein